MKQVVRDTYVDFTTKFEGSVPWMYADVKGLVTVAIGNLIDASPHANPWGPAIGLPFEHPDGTQATPQEITTAWLAVKGDPNAARFGHRYAKDIVGNGIRLSQGGISKLVFRKLDENDTVLCKRFADFEEWPADAQLATHSLSWACGVYFHFPLLERALRAKDFREAVDHCKMNETGNPGLIPRNKANRTLYRNAACVQSFKLDGECLYYPTGLSLEETEDTGPGSGA